MDLALAVHGVADMYALDKEGRDGLQSLLPSCGDVGSGILFALHDAWARNFADHDRFVNVLRSAYAVFRSNPTALRALAESSLFEEDLKRALRELADCSMEAFLVIENAVHFRQTGRALLGIAASLVEGPGQVFATTLLLACGRKSAVYSNLRHKNATELVGAAQEEPALQGLLDGLDCDLRTGRAHVLVRYEPDSAVIERKSSTRQIEWADVLDSVFQGLESVHACLIALLQVLSELGFANFALNELWRDMGLAADQMTTMVLKTTGYRDVSITNQGKRWQIKARAEPGTPLPNVIALILRTLPEDLESVLLAVYQDGINHVLSGPLAPWRDWSRASAGTEEHEMAFFRAQLTWTYDGQAWLPTDFIRRWVSLKAQTALKEPLPKAIARLRAFRDLAALVKDETLIWALSGAIRSIRLVADSSSTAELTELAAWGSATVTSPWWQQ